MNATIPEATVASSKGSTGSALVRLTTYVPVEVLAQVNALAERDGRTRANTARHLLESWLRAHPVTASSLPRPLNFAVALGPTGYDEEMNQ
ncbi:ribbon-helix-helix domain-containing protein [Streptomyces gilvus]|uniref:ribbon-helix-helix domain-containing protein n=1 Tax=Streptomyces gilvus TaxID=2920937 RepID=UPI001F0EE17D|nr:hypothetical protein [Streptomyces sp. CME 23]MCH5677917.1 hypothetical protein [Streptomyces sp. CME 23]